MLTDFTAEVAVRYEGSCPPGSVLNPFAGKGNSVMFLLLHFAFCILQFTIPAPPV